MAGPARLQPCRAACVAYCCTPADARPPLRRHAAGPPRAVFSRFAEKGIAVYSGDIVGHGRSEGHRALMESYPEAVSGGVPAQRRWGEGGWACAWSAPRAALCWLAGPQACALGSPPTPSLACCRPSESSASHLISTSTDGRVLGAVRARAPRHWHPLPLRHPRLVHRRVRPALACWSRAAPMLPSQVPACRPAGPAERASREACPPASSAPRVQALAGRPDGGAGVPARPARLGWHAAVLCCAGCRHEPDAAVRLRRGVDSQGLPGPRRRALGLPACAACLLSQLDRPLTGHAYSANESLCACSIQSMLGGVLAKLIPRARIVPAVAPADMNPGAWLAWWWAVLGCAGGRQQGWAARPAARLSDLASRAAGVPLRVFPPQTPSWLRSTAAMR